MLLMEHGTLILWTQVNEGLLMAADKRSVRLPLEKRKYSDRSDKIKPITNFDLAAHAGITSGSTGLLSLVFEQLPYPWTLWGCGFYPINILKKWADSDPEKFQSRRATLNLQWFLHVFRSQLARVSQSALAQQEPGLPLASLTLISLREGEIDVAMLVGDMLDGRIRALTLNWPLGVEAVGSAGDVAVVRAVRNKDYREWGSKIVEPIEHLMDPNALRSRDDGIKLLGTLFYLSNLYGKQEYGIASVSKCFDAYLLSAAGIQKVCSAMDSSECVTST